MGEAKRRRTKLSALELSPHLERQINFLKRSVDAYDSGFEDEAVRLAVVLRVLLHETAHSKSLLGQLDGFPNFVDSAVDFDPDNLIGHGGLVAMAMGPTGGRYIAPLDDVPRTRVIPFDDWWRAKIFAATPDKSLSRKELVLVAANQDGGAHVDTELDEVYYDLSKNNALGWLVQQGEVEAIPFGSPIFPAIRQVSHEVLKSLIWGYKCKPKSDFGMMVMGASVKAN